jgi:pimeloyl-ACP methyl ester carboxylesterase
MIGTTLSHYRIVEKIGAGGMGEVYRAHDERLDRDVAIKVLPEEVVQGEERLARFEREAKLLASLSHQNIATLYGFESFEISREDVGAGFTPAPQVDGAGDEPPPYVRSGPVHCLIMELAEGETLAERIKKRPIPVEDSLPIVLQIAEGLEAAHEQGVIHRDLKPANVMLSPEGKVKVLDFGLAKAWQVEVSDADLTHSPTLTAQMTADGALLGTAAYMSPEQVRGKAVDTRADIWAFGVVLWEMLTGRRPFEGDAASDVLAAILRDEPDWQHLPGGLPRAVGRVLRRCLRRDVTKRLRHIGDARLELAEAWEEPAIPEYGVPSGVGRGEIGAERSWALTAAVCRHLHRETLDPAIIGDELRYLDNDRPSDVLVVYVPGFGFDHGAFSEILSRSRYRGVAVTLYGFEETRRRRTPLPIADHLTIVRLFLESMLEASKPGTVVLAGFSSGADIVLRLISEGGVDHRHIDGVLALSPNVSLETCFFTKRVAEILDGSDGEILDIARDVAAAMDTPLAWLQINPYLMELVRKYHADIDALRTHGRDILTPFLAVGESPFAGWYRAVKETGIGVRVVFAGAEDSEQKGLGQLMLAHVDHQVLGPDFSDDDIVCEPNAPHMGLMNTEVVERHLEELLGILREASSGKGK